MGENSGKLKAGALTLGLVAVLTAFLLCFGGVAGIAVDWQWANRVEPRTGVAIDRRIGSSATRGLGAMRVKLEGLRWWQAGRAQKPAGPCALDRPLEVGYGWLSDGALPAEDAPVAARGGRQWAWEGDAASSVLRHAQEFGFANLDAWRPEGER